MHNDKKEDLRKLIPKQMETMNTWPPNDAIASGETNV